MKKGEFKNFKGRRQNREIFSYDNRVWIVQSCDRGKAITADIIAVATETR